MTQQTPAGWYPDPENEEDLRYWDGSAWTDHRTNATPASNVSQSESVEQDPSGGSTPLIPGNPNGKKPWYGRWWGITLIAVGVLAVVGGIFGEDPQPQSASTQEPSVSASPTVDPSQAAEAAAEEAKEAAKEKAEAEAKAKAKRRAAARAQREARKEARKLAREEAARTNPAKYKAISDRDYKLLVKDPDSHVGERFVVYGHVTQFDSATGTDTFLASTSSNRSGDWFDYDTNTLASSDDASLFKNVVEDDLVTMYVDVLGSFSYDTQIGGNTTVPHLAVNIIEVTGSS